ncbi:hypothetical protein RIF29_17971 [Crotalaria pallida]|uniref:Uncharacterized protein n=1 Tax=Crotalaria pallida TaxID=3830 RepID=A0AAN9FNZ5_CROPI
MADFTAPSFSLGFDDDPHLSFDSHLPHTLLNHDHHDSGPQVPDSDPDSGPHPPPRPILLKRLRRGPPPPSLHHHDDDDDDIEDDDDDDDAVLVHGAHARLSAQNRSVCSSSKVSLKGCGVLTPHSSSCSREGKRKLTSDNIPASVKMETGQSGLMFPKLTTTPIRRFQLLDSDSDDPVGEDVTANHKTDPCSTGATHNQSKPVTSCEQNGSARMEMGQSGLKYPKLTSSPLRRFQLLDSDSDDPVGEDVSAAHKIDPCSKDPSCDQSKPMNSFEQNGSERMETGRCGLRFPKSTNSPLRRFQLIDSDSDDPVGEDVSASHKIYPCSTQATRNQSTPVTAFEHNGSSSMETGQSAFVFPKLTTSPLRRFQLIDSDSDDPVGGDVSAAHKFDPCSKDATCNQGKSVNSFEKSRKTSLDMDQNQDLWKDFSPMKKFSIPTPAFDEVCEEYFRSAKGKQVEKPESHSGGYFGASSSYQSDQQLWESAGPLPPAHRYFFHEDPRIQQLVQRRLCNFSPLGVHRVNQQPNISHIDYMGQFGSASASRAQEAQKGNANSSVRGKNKSINLTVEETFDSSGGWVDPKFSSITSNGESSRKKTTKRNSTKNSVSRGKNKTNKSTSSNVSYASENWVEPKSCANMPKDAGKRRVQASAQSSGHWYTSDGRRVYVSKSGQELTGRIAYRQYRKESGAGFKKSKAKTSAKKANAKKRN